MPIYPRGSEPKIETELTQLSPKPEEIMRYYKSKHPWYLEEQNMMIMAFIIVMISFNLFTLRHLFLMKNQGWKRITICTSIIGTVSGAIYNFVIYGATESFDDFCVLWTCISIGLALGVFILPIAKKGYKIACENSILLSKWIKEGFDN